MTWGIDCVIEYRGVLALSVSAVGGTLGLRPYPFPADHAALALVHLSRATGALRGTHQYARRPVVLVVVLPAEHRVLVALHQWSAAAAALAPPHRFHRILHSNSARTFSCC